MTLGTDHYDETTHTASGLSATVSAGGTASATCATCHDPNPASGPGGLAGQHTNITPAAGSPYGPTVACVECHSDLRANGNVEVLAGWTADACSDCHTIGSSAPQHASTAPVTLATSGEGCGASGTNCHTTYDVHALHKDAAGGCTLSGCHDTSLQGAKPTATSCGTGDACHTTYTATTHTHAADAAKHQPTASTQASATTFYATACGSCHDIRTSGSSLTTEHALATSAKTTNANTCLNCHNNNIRPVETSAAIQGNWSAKDTTSACSTCHTGALSIHTGSVDTTHTKTNTGCASTGAGCHPTSILSQVGVPSTTANIHTSCLRCHDRAGAASWTSAMLAAPGNVRYGTVSTCGAATGCHTSAYYNPAAGATQYYHRIGQANVVTGDDAKHTANGMASTENSGTATNVCSDCHIGTLASEHTTTGPSASPVKVGCTTGGYAGNTAGCHNTTTGTIAPGSATAGQEQLEQRLQAVLGLPHRQAQRDRHEPHRHVDPVLRRVRCRLPQHLRPGGPAQGPRGRRRLQAVGLPRSGHQERASVEEDLRKRPGLPHGLHPDRRPPRQLHQPVTTRRTPRQRWHPRSTRLPTLTTTRARAATAQA